MIGPRTAALLFALLIAVSFLALHGTARTLALIIVLGLAAKGFLQYVRAKNEASELQADADSREDLREEEHHGRKDD